MNADRWRANAAWDHMRRECSAVAGACRYVLWFGQAHCKKKLHESESFQ